jgi:regulator of sigma E protease
MGNFIGSLLSFLFVVGILVFIHEFGHFFMAKLAGVRVEVFSFGFGKRLFGFRRGHTDYRVSLIPMGGYVKMLGEGMFEPDKELAPDDLMSKTRFQRFLIMVMGSVMNILLAIALVAVISGIGVSVPEYHDKKPAIGWIDPGSPAEQSGLLVGDEILRINGRAVPTWNDVEIAVGTKPERMIRLDVRRDGRDMTVDLMTEKVSRFEMGYAGFRAEILTQVQMVNPGSPAEAAGLRPGDVIRSIDGEPVFFYRFVEVIESNPETPLRFAVEREGEPVEIVVTPRREGQVGRIGVMQGPASVVKKYGFFAAIGQSLRENLRNVFLIVRFLKDLFTGEASTRQLGGPLEIANFSYAAVRMGWLALMSWIAVISLQLGIINLLPIPVFDGGQIFVLMVEGILRRDLSPRLRQIWMQIGFVIFVALIGFVILNDVVKRLPEGWKSLLPF